jgi:hypothetical protein
MSEENQQRTDLESKKYFFRVENTMPILNFELVSPEKDAQDSKREHLNIELHAPISGEIFEARTAKGRIEVDSDGTITYFSMGEMANFSMFLGRSLSVLMNKTTGEVLLKTPARIKMIEDLRSKESKKGEPSTDQIRIILE